MGNTKDLFKKKWGQKGQKLYGTKFQPWDLFGRNDAKAETPLPWPRHEKS